MTEPVAPAQQASPPAARFIALRSRDFRLLLAGQAISLTGSQMQQVAVVWQLYLLSGSPLALGMLGFFRIVPIIVFALGGGVVADALDRRRLMLFTQTALAMVSVALAVLAHAQRTTPAAIYALAFVAGAATAFDNPARQALVPRLVDREHLPNALSLYATVWQVATIAGPALGGALLAWSGPTAIYLLDVLSFGAVIAALLAMKHRHVGLGKSQISAKAALDGLRFIRRTPLIWSTMLLDFAATFFAGSMLLLPIFADQLLHVGPRGLGFLYAAQPAGAALTGAAIAVFGISPWFWLSFLMLALSGAADTVSMVIRQTIRQTLTPDELRGRMSSVNMIFFMGGPQLGEVEAGVVARLVGVRVAVGSGGLLCAAIAAAVALLVPALRRYQD